MHKLTWTIGLGMLALIACGSDDDGGGGTSSCAQNPWSCAAGTTCWATTTQGSFSCLPSGTKQKGEQCVNGVGMADCADGLFCFQNAATPGDPATCHAFCNAAHPCGSGEGCAMLQNTAVQICVSTGGIDAGTDAPSSGGAGGGDASTDAPSSGGAGGSGGGSGSAGAAGAGGATVDAATDGP